MGRFTMVLWIVVVCAIAAAGFKYYKYNFNCLAVYDLTWPNEYKAGETLYKWRYFIEPRSHLPRKIEKYSKTNADADYVLRETLIIDYPSDEEIRKVTKDNGFNDSVIPQR